MLVLYSQENISRKLSIMRNHISLLRPSFVNGCFLSGTLCILSLSGCTHKVQQAPKSGNVFRYALTTEPTDLDPARVEDGTTIDLLQQVFEGLVRWNVNNEIEPNLAVKWDLSADGKTYTFHLRKDVKFHNGRLMTADDFKYSFERACAPATKSTTPISYLKDIVGAADCIQGKAKDISGIKVIDSNTLQITIDDFKPYWMGNMTYPCAYVVCKEAIEKNGGKLDEISAVGTGPFKFKEFRRGYQVVLEANTDYHFGRPKLDEIYRPIIKDAITRLNKYEADELDILTDVSPHDLDHINADPKLKADLKSFKRSATWYIGLNSAAKGSPFGNRDVRRAFAMAIDKGEAVRIALKGQADVADGIVPPGIAGYDQPIKPIPYDPVQAKALLAKAGYPDGKGFPTLTLSFRQDLPQVADTAQVIFKQLKNNLGIDIQLRPMEWAQFLTERTNKTMALSHLRWSADYLDPQNFLSVLLHSSKIVNGAEDHPENGVGYANPVYDKLCDSADVEHNSKLRMQMYHQAEQMAVDDAPWVPIYFQRDLELDKPRVHNLRDSLLGHLPHLTTTVTP